MKSAPNSPKQINKGSKSHKDTSPKPDRRKKLLTMAPNPEIETNYDYVYQLKSMIADERITNIAFEGDYGSGKSSIIRKLITDDNFSKRYKPKTISFITLNSEDLKKRKTQKYNTLNNKDGESNNQIAQRANGADIANEQVARPNKQSKASTGGTIQYSPSITEIIQSEIVKQLFYGEKPNSTKWSNYGRLGRTYYLISAIIATILQILLFKFLVATSEEINESTGIFQNYQISTDFVSIATILAFLLSVITLTYIINNVLSSVLNGKIRYISAKDFSLEIADREPDFDQMIDLLISYFSHTKHKVIVFEDLDRFGDAQIFEEIKQLNTIINNSDSVKDKITFIYAIRGSIIKKAEDRAKLFDAIIPIIPFYSKNNVETIFQEVLKDAGIDNNISSGIIGSVSEYIKDIRVMYSIANNLIVLSDIYDMRDELTIKSCTSLAVIKTLYPDEYDKITTGKEDSKIESVLKDIRKERQTRKASIDDKYNIDKILERNKDSIFSNLFSYSRYYRPNIVPELPSTITIDSIKYNTDNLNMSVLYNATELEIFWPAHGTQLYKKHEIDACFRKIKEIDAYESGEYVAEMQNEYFNLRTAKNEVLYNENFLDDKNNYPAINTLFKKGHILDGISFYAAKTNYSKTELQIQKFIYEQIRLEKIDETLDISDYVDKLIDKIFPEDFRSIGIYNYDIFDYLTSSHIDKKDIDKKYQIAVDSIEDNEEVFRSFIYNYAIRDINKLQNLSFTRNASINEELSKLCPKSGFMRLVSRIIDVYPKITIWLSTELYEKNKSIATLILNKSLMSLNDASIEIDGAYKAILPLFAPYIVETNTEKYIKLLAANQMPLFDISELAITNKDKTIKLINETNIVIYLNRNNIDYLGEDNAKLHLIKTYHSDYELLETADYSKSLLEFIVNNPSILIDSRSQDETIITIYKKAIKQKVSINKESMVYCAKYLGQSSLIKLVLNSHPDKETIENTASRNEDEELKKIINGGYIKIKNTDTNTKFAEILKELGIAKNYWLRDQGVNLIIHVPKDKSQT